MKTDKNILFHALLLINDKPMALETALIKASNKIGLPLLDNNQLIRDYLREKQLINHNARLTFKNVRNRVENTTVEFVGDEIHEDFVNDHVTDTCTQLIHDEALLEFLTNKRIETN